MAPETARGFTHALIARVDTACAHQPEPAAQRIARQCLFDWLVVTLAGQATPLVGRLRATLAREGGHDHASLIGLDGRVPASHAALINGTAGHALDYDDVNIALPGHPSVPLLPALCALSEREGFAGRALIAAFIRGYEFECRVGLALGPSHYARGFHATATVGALGAAVGCATLLALDPGRTAHAVGIAATLAAGLKGNFGNDCKPLHAGEAARAGLLAADLAASGTCSREDILECAQGFAETHADRLDVDAALADPPGGLHLHQNLFKYHASCYETHAALECTRRLARLPGWSAETIARLEVRVNPYCDRICNIMSPQTELEAKFSLRQTVALAAAGHDTGDVASYAEERLRDAEILRLRERVTIILDPDLSPATAGVRLVRTDGTTRSEFHDAALPCADLDVQDQRLMAKARSLLRHRVPTARIEAIRSAVDGLGSREDLRRLMALVRREPGT